MSIEAIQINLFGVVTEEVNIETFSTGCVPFLGVDLNNEGFEFDQLPI